mgnify:CR=1 FL=1
MELRGIIKNNQAIEIVTRDHKGIYHKYIIAPDPNADIRLNLDEFNKLLQRERIPKAIIKKFAQRIPAHLEDKVE